MKKIKASVIIPSWNGLEYLKICLPSIKKQLTEVVEVIIVDNGSTDRSVSYIKENFPKIKYIKLNKNFGFSKAKEEWILSLDADERVTQELQESIQSAIEKNEDVIGYWIPRRNIIFGKWIAHTGWYPDYQLRLFREGEGKFPELHVHEMLQVDGKTAYLKEDLLHYNYETVSQFLKKHIELYADSEVERLITNGYRFSHKDAIAFPLNEFLSRFFAREGYKDGFHGLMLSLLLAFYHFVIFTKMWEKEGFKEYEESNFLESVASEFRNAHKDMSYWLASERMKTTKSIFKKMFFRLQRKLRA